MSHNKTSLLNTNNNTDINMEAVTQFLLSLDALKHVNRRSYTTSKDISGAMVTKRLENSAEHSWHLAMACWSIAEQFSIDVNIEQLLKMALVHDLGEIDAGDTFLYADTRNTAHIDERDGIARLQNERGNGITNLSDIWEAQETGDSNEARLIKVIDRLLPFLLNMNTGGITWSKLSITRTQVENAHAFIADSFPIIHEWIAEQIKFATQQGWLINK